MTNNEFTVNNHDLAELYQKVIQLSTKDKISSKNAWELNLIEHLDRCIYNEQNTDINYSKASATIKASSEIYTARVDSVYTDLYKVLNGLSRHTGGPKIDDLSVEGKPKPKKSRPVKTIQADLTKITESSLESPAFVDPLFQKVTSKFDASKSEGLLLNNLGVLCGACVAFDEMTVVNTEKFSLAREIADSWIPSIDQLSDTKICARYSSLSMFDNSTSTKDIEAPIKDFENYNKDDESDAGYASDAWDTPEDDDAVAGDQFFPSSLSQNDNSGFDDGFHDEAYGQDATEEAGFAPGAGKKESAAFLYSDDAYNFFDPSLFKNWCGPDHWKFKRPKGALKTTRAETVDKRAKKPKLIDFSTIDLNAFFPKEKVSKTSTILSNSTLVKQRETLNTLPKDEHYKVGELCKLFLKPNWMIGKRSAKARDDQPDFQLVQQQDDFGDIDDGFDMEDTNFESSFAQGSVTHSNTPLDLVDDRRRVAQIDIQYARKATKMDVGLLKANMFESINNSEEGTEDQGEDHSFRKIINEMPQKMPESISQNVSVPMCFVCLLHLANEKNFKIEQDSNLSDLMVSFA